jgi:hypothetical protein
MNVRTLAASALLALSPALAGAGQEAPSPPASGLVTVTLGAETERLWPFTADDFSGTPKDPVNLVFFGADPRAVRQALLALDGDRTAFGFPAGFPFDCLWSDAGGDEQAAWAASEGWAGGAIQLQCGAFGPFRIHLRLFRQGANTLGGAHFEFLISGTAEHEPLGWDYPRRLITADMARAGVLTNASEVPLTDLGGSYRTIRHQVFNVLIGIPDLVPLLVLVLGLPDEPQAAPVPIPADGRVSLLKVAAPFDPVQSHVGTQWDIEYDVMATTHPFCDVTGAYGVIAIQGEVHLALAVHTNPSGKYSRTFTAAGTLYVTPLDPRTLAPNGPTVEAIVSEDHRALLTDNSSQVHQVLLRDIFGDPAQSLFTKLDAGESDRFVKKVECGSNP